MAKVSQALLDSPHYILPSKHSWLHPLNTGPGPRLEVYSWEATTMLCSELVLWGAGGGVGEGGDRQTD